MFLCTPRDMNENKSGSSIGSGVVGVGRVVVGTGVTIGRGLLRRLPDRVRVRLLGRGGDGVVGRGGV